MKFQIEQIAINPPDAGAAMALLAELGLSEWTHDVVVASGTVLGKRGSNTAQLHFNYQAARDDKGLLEFEVLAYDEGPNWLSKVPSSVSHLGMHCTAAELVEWRAKFAELGIAVAQEVMTESHTNPAIVNRRYNYVIFATRAVLGVDLKFIVRYNSP